MRSNMYCLSIDKDTGDINIMPERTPMEPVPYGCYIPHDRGTLEQMEQKKQLLINERIQHVRRIKKNKVNERLH